LLRDPSEVVWACCDSGEHGAGQELEVLFDIEANGARGDDAVIAHSSEEALGDPANFGVAAQRPAGSAERRECDCVGERAVGAGCEATGTRVVPREVAIETPRGRRAPG